ncbi:hypothetical protein HMPREF9184_00159 [Streptococcus sp. oral taxon 058 str. F0407]|nr:hypothetical protein HMPREF9184_00159 [Streptococcus sp. oral taxon 058 str. F0407]
MTLKRVTKYKKPHRGDQFDLLFLFVGRELMISLKSGARRCKIKVGS